MKTHLGVTTLWIGNVFFVLGYTIVKLLPTDIPTHEVVLFRFLIPPLFLLPFFVMQKVPFSVKNPKLLILRSIIGSIGMFMTYLALRSGEFGKMMLLVNLSVVWTFVLSIFIFNEKITLSKLVGIASAMVGVMLILKPTGLLAIGKPELYALVASICTAIVSVSIKQLREDHNSLTLIFVFFSVSTLFFLGPNIYQFVRPDFWVLCLLLLIGFLGFMAHFFMTASYKYISSTVATTVSLSTIPMSYLIGVFCFHEFLDWASLGGILVFLVGLYFILDKSAR